MFFYTDIFFPEHSKQSPYYLLILNPNPLLIKSDHGHGCTLLTLLTLLTLSLQLYDFLLKPCAKMTHGKQDLG